MEHFNNSGYILFLATVLMITVTPFVAPYFKEWVPSASGNHQPGHRIYSRVMVISLVPLLISFAIAPASAKDLFILATDAGYEYFIVDSEILQHKISLSEVESPRALDLFASLPNNTLALRRSNIFDRAITFDPGFRTSLTNRLITIAGRIDWGTTKPDFTEGERAINKQALAYLSIKEHPNSLLMADQATTMFNSDADIR